MSDILDLGDLVPETKPIRMGRIVKKIEHPNGEIEYITEPHVFRGFVYGPRCPVLVKSSLKQVVREMARKQEQEGYSDELFQTYARDSFIHLIPGISFDEADLLAADDDTKDGKCIKVLRYLNYWQEAKTGDDKIEDPDPEVVGEEKQTTVKSSPI